MSKIGIIANPHSGKDIRRLFSYALTIGNNEKANLVQRMILGAQDLGVKETFIMPDTYNIGENIKVTLQENDDLKSTINILNYKPEGSPEDTIKATRLMKQYNVKCLIVLGGDGTSRLVAKAMTNIPIISVSTGTNNVYPDLLEGTTVGMAAAYIAKNGINNKYIWCDKLIEIYRNGKLEDVALIDAVISKNIFVGTRAISEVDDIVEVIVSRSHPASIGFSSIIGVHSIADKLDDFGYRVEINKGDIINLSPMGAGKMTKIRMTIPEKLLLDNVYSYYAEYDGTIALDGERTIIFNKNDKLGFVIRKNGPIHVDVKKALETAVEDEFFKVI